MLHGDGCSGFLSFTWRKLSNSPPPFEGFCDLHDEAYRVGGSLWKRVVADCVMARGVWTKSKFWSVVMFIAVRVGGVWIVPFPTLIPKADGSWEWNWWSVRWGYGYRYPFYAEGQTWGDLLYPRIWLVILVMVLWLT